MRWRNGAARLVGAWTALSDIHLLSYTSHTLGTSWYLDAASSRYHLQVEYTTSTQRNTTAAEPALLWVRLEKKRLRRVRIISGMVGCRRRAWICLSYLSITDTGVCEITTNAYDIIVEDDIINYSYYVI